VAKKLVFVQPPTTAAAGAEIPAITVKVTDTYGNLITNSSASVMLVIQSSPKGGTFTSVSSGGTFTSLTVPARGGVATFSHVALTMAGTYKLKVTAMKLTPVTSDSFTLS
jgi:hypothetical protein